MDYYFSKTMQGSFDEAVAKVTDEGKEYNLCCPGCIKTFKADPEKYSKIAEESLKR